jgi:hypothetical protein
VTKAGEANCANLACPRPEWFPSDHGQRRWPNGEGIEIFCEDDATDEMSRIVFREAASDNPYNASRCKKSATFVSDVVAESAPNDGQFTAIH